MTERTAKAISLAIVARWVIGRMPLWSCWMIDARTHLIRDEVGNIETIVTYGYLLKARCDAQEQLRVGDKVAVKVAEGHLIYFVLTRVAQSFQLGGFAGLEVEGEEVSQQLSY